MKIKNLISGFMLFACLGVSAETILTVEYLDGKTAQEQLAKVSKIVFDNGENISISYSDGGSKDFGKISNTQKIVFAEGEISSVEQSSAASVKIYPNPTTESISVDGLSEGQEVKIYSVSGKLAISTNESVINVGNLSNGEYIVVAGQTVAKIIKK